ncbi:MAG: phosphoglycolate phosphatase [Phenylobacterium sp.]|uniref:phosphoglycolate phosphatase n=1 Tax=Phenylobacterium sp. TaxID=1871053 RepID=UPI00120460E8|nr:phosphoglycolate phosphatase [Phenylobacterium sp.]TAJ70843.1 MAG: phosphoglycolate phosphatase [Phenylobacterium sp.]
MAASALEGAVIAFDLDGTLVDTAPDLIGTLNVLLKDEGLPARPLDEARPFIGRGARWLIERGFEAAGQHLHPARVQPLFDRFIAHYLEHIADESRPFPGCEAALDALKAQGARLAVCTNKRTDLSMALLEALGLADRFEAVIGADRAPAIKPDPRHLQAAVDAVGGDIGRTILVGDAATDAGAARAAKAGLILVSFGYTEIPAEDLNPDILIHSFDELPEACGRLLGRTWTPERTARA